MSVNVFVPTGKIESDFLLIDEATTFADLDAIRIHYGLKPQFPGESINTYRAHLKLQMAIMAGYPYTVIHHETEAYERLDAWIVWNNHRACTNTINYGVRRRSLRLARLLN